MVDDSSTIRRVVTSILERHGYETAAAPDAQIALDALTQEDAPRFDLILVDFVMPRMNGFQFCRELRKSEVGQDLPVVLMSAKSDRIREKFVLQTGAVDAITKPFDAKALVTLIEHALSRIADGKVAERVASAHVLEGNERPSNPPPSFPAPRAAVDPQALVLSGDVAGVPIGAVMQLLQIESLSGLLVVTSGESEIRILMEKGRIDRVHSRGARDEFRLGRFFVEEGLVTPEEIDALLSAPPVEPPAVEGRGPSSTAASDANDGQNPRDPGPLAADDSGAFRQSTARRQRLGDVLLGSEKITEAQLRTALTRQSSELVYELLRWQTGRFELRAAAAPEDAREPRLGLPVAAVVMEGFRRVDEWRLIESKLGNFDEVLMPDQVALDSEGVRESMTKPERTVLQAIDSRRTLREVVDASHLSSFDALKIVCQFLEARLVRRRAAS